MWTRIRPCAVALLFVAIVFLGSRLDAAETIEADDKNPDAARIEQEFAEKVERYNRLLKEDRFDEAIVLGKEARLLQGGEKNATPSGCSDVTAQIRLPPISPLCVESRHRRPWWVACQFRRSRMSEEPKKPGAAYNVAVGLILLLLLYLLSFGPACWIASRTIRGATTIGDCYRPITWAMWGNERILIGMNWYAQLGSNGRWEWRTTDKDPDRLVWTYTPIFTNARPNTPWPTSE